MVAEIDLVEIKLQNLIFGQRLLDLERQQHLANLAGIGLAVAQKEVTRQLHGYGAAALDLSAGADQLVGGAQQTAYADARMLIETGVLGREKSVDQLGRNLVEAQRIAALVAILRHKFVICAIYLQRDLELHIAQGRNVRQVWRKIEISGCRKQHAKAEKTRENGEEGTNKLAENSHEGVIMRSNDLGGYG